MAEAPADPAVEAAAKAIYATWWEDGEPDTSALWENLPADDPDRKDVMRMAAAAVAPLLAERNSLKAQLATVRLIAWDEGLDISSPKLRAAIGPAASAPAVSDSTEVDFDSLDPERVGARRQVTEPRGLVPAVYLRCKDGWYRADEHDLVSDENLYRGANIVQLDRHPYVAPYAPTEEIPDKTPTTKQDFDRLDGGGGY